jgi:hypothetical protein
LALRASIPWRELRNCAKIFGRLERLAFEAHAETHSEALPNIRGLDRVVATGLPVTCLQNFPAIDSKAE